MKSMEDYINLEQTIYQNILQNRNDILQEITQLSATELASYESIVIFATGSSSNAAFAAQPYMASKLQIPVYIEEPSFAANYMMHLNQKTLYLAISQGGHSYSTIHIVEEIEKHGGTVFTLTSDLESPIAKKAKHVIGMGIGVEEMPYVTAGYSATILILDLLALELSRQMKRLHTEDYEKELDEMSKIARFLPEVIAKAEWWIEGFKEEFLTAERMIFVGYGSTYGVAREGETKITETVRISAFGKELEEYMHGPYIGLAKTDRIFFIEPHGKLEERAEKLKQFLEGHVETVYTIYADKVEERQARDLMLGVQTSEYLASLFTTIPVHLLSYKVSQWKGINLEISAYPEFDRITGSKI
ncbi:SIS domain-containing protein [Listeria aquatica]|uniref:SIS domain-containing protein n=1 Tax=Listeria aquatica TaxID=1494960 RepID=UPI003F7012E2